MIHKPGAQKAQQTSSRNIVTDLRSRDRYMIAFNEAAGAFDLTAFDVSLEFVVRLGNRIALHHRCKPPHRCDPGEDLLAKEMHVSERKVQRGIAALKALGWIAGKRGGSTDKVNITLCIPQAAEPDVEEHPVAENDDLIPAKILSPMDAAPYPTKTPSIPDTQCGGTYEQRNRDRSAASPRATGLADREEQAFRQLVELRPLSSPNQEVTARAAFGALLKITDIDHIIDEACTFEKRPEDCVKFLAYLTDNNPKLTHASS
ncbi:hypothetical protein [Bradyrhizobium erythrophlei]|uniref:Helix-turn-helix domain-containing protein n=1 Tax=Bradyrhizobium erythrophlei TaxID=1437360 RepID=A0A1M7UW50_9BRAD|nr:hypothetical protein [Bradyrhizobium erythrophlei]SHN87168.1 hypothetical protein SAMN05444170_7040 [Bradyrhizobium erythrophlei]